MFPADREPTNKVPFCPNVMARAFTTLVANVSIANPGGNLISSNGKSLDVLGRTLKSSVAPKTSRLKKDIFTTFYDLSLNMLKEQRGTTFNL